MTPKPAPINTIPPKANQIDGARKTIDIPQRRATFIPIRR
jgi:hypothetical protein